ncbi:MAG: DUF1206 domain-containing protein [Gammaproteobacteria bacterium]
MTRDALTILARAGYAARGVVYLVIGGLAVQAAFATGGGTTGSKGAIREMMSQPWGQFIVALIAAGLIGYAIWRFTQAIYDADDHGTDAKGIAIRAGLFVSALTHSALAIYALTLLGVGSGGSGSGEAGRNSAETWTATLLSQPYGQWLVGILGAVVIGVGVAHTIKAKDTKFERYLDMDEQKMKIGRPIAIFGLVARGVVFVIIGGFFIAAAWQAQPEEAKSLGETLGTLQQQPYGSWLLGIVALGLIAFGLYSIMEAFYRVIPKPASALPGRDSGAAENAATEDYRRSVPR